MNQGKIIEFDKKKFLFITYSNILCSKSLTTKYFIQIYNNYKWFIVYANVDTKIIFIIWHQLLFDPNNMIIQFKNCYVIKYICNDLCISSNKFKFKF